MRIARARPYPAFSHLDERYSREKTAKCVSDDGGDETESLTELSTTEETSSTSDFALIAKPPGEVGRPGRGGYNLQKVLENHGWDKNSFSIRRVSRNYLILLRGVYQIIRDMCAISLTSISIVACRTRIRMKRRYSWSSSL